MSELTSRYADLFNVSASSSYSYLDPNSVLKNNDNYWCSDLLDKGSITIYSKRNIVVYKYVLLVRPYSSGQFPRSWNVTSNIDGKEVLLNHVEESNLNSEKLEYSSRFSMYGPLEYIKIQSLKNNYAGNPPFCVKRIMLFGNFDDYYGCSCHYYNTKSLIICFIILIKD